MYEESKSVEARIVGTGVLWVMGVALLIWHTADGPHAAGIWGLLVCGVAGCWTMSISQSMSNRRQLAAIKRELALLRMGEDDRDDGLRSV